MTNPMAICLEDLEFRNEEDRYLCCAVEVGRAPGLSVDNKGTTQWLVNNDAAFQLFVTMDDCLGLYRLSGGAPVQVHRAGRSLDVPFEKPVILRHGDELLISERRYRVHVHGQVSKTYAPYFFKEHLTQVAKTAAAVLLGAAISATGCGDRSVQSAGKPTVPTSSFSSDGQIDSDEDGLGLFFTDTETNTDSSDAIEVRDFPPEALPE